MKKNYKIKLRASNTLEKAIYQKFYELGKVMHSKDLYSEKGFVLKNQLHLEKN